MSQLSDRLSRLVICSLAVLTWFPVTLLAAGSFIFGTTGSLMTERSYHTATLLPDGKVLVSGGNMGNTVTATSELYDPATGIWSPTGSLHQARCRHSAVLLPTGLVLVVGGQVTGDGLTSAEIYDPATGNWTATGSLAEGRSSLTATLLPDGRVLAIGGGGTAARGHLRPPRSTTRQQEHGRPRGACQWRDFVMRRRCCRTA